MSKKRRKSYSREFKKEAVALITENGYSIAEASRNLGIEYSILRRWKQQLAEDSQNAFPGKCRQKPGDQELRDLKKELEWVKKTRHLKKSAGLLCGGSEMKLQFIADHRETFKVGRMCALLNASPLGFTSGLHDRRVLETLKTDP